MYVRARKRIRQDSLQCRDIEGGVDGVNRTTAGRTWQQFKCRLDCVSAVNEHTAVILEGRRVFQDLVCSKFMHLYSRQKRA